MRVELTMPQMGESIAEGTISRWRKKVGERVERDEPIVEISTDKVDAEIPAPAAGTLVEILSREGETVPVNQVIAVIEAEGAPAPVEAARRAAPPIEAAAAPEAEATERRRFVTPVVRRIAAEHGVDPASVPGTGLGGRVTKKDILAFLEAAPAPAPPRADAGGERVTRERMSVMRKRIAEHMVESRRVSAHVHTVFEVDMTRIARLRERHAPAFVERHGVKLTPTPFLVRAVCAALPSFPLLNASLEGDDIVYRRDINVGVAVALDWGLIVPVLHGADRLSLAGVALRLQDLAARARAKRLDPGEVQGGTFTITNPGQFGGAFGLPIIHQPQVAILGAGGIEKRPVVVDDAIAIRSMMFLALSFDHRVIDGAVADRFMAAIKAGLERFDEPVL